MTESHASEGDLGQPSRQDMMSALFANLVIQQTNMALMFLGRVPNPETGERAQNLEAARVFIDQLEMIDVKTKGNLDKREDHLLKQSLTTLRMAFVEAVEAPSSGPSKPAGQPEPAVTTPAGAPGAAAGGTPPPTPPAEESHKKFSKKY